MKLKRTTTENILLSCIIVLALLVLGLILSALGKELYKVSFKPRHNLTVRYVVYYPNTKPDTLTLTIENTPEDEAFTHSNRGSNRLTIGSKTIYSGTAPVKLLTLTKTPNKKK